MNNPSEKYLKEMNKGNYALALTLLDTELQKKPDDMVLLYNFGICCSRTGNHKKCVSILEDVLRISNGYIEKDNIYRLIIYSLIHLNEWDRALFLTDERLKVNVGDIRLLSFRAHIIERMGKIQDAIQIHRNILKINPEYKNSLNSVAYLITTLPDPTTEEINEAVDCIRKALVQDSENPAYLDTFGVILKMKGNREQAKIAFQKAISRSRVANSVILEHMQDLL